MGAPHRVDNMIRSSIARTFVGLWGLWFAAAALELPSVNPCPMHGIAAHRGSAMDHGASGTAAAHHHHDAQAGADLSSSKRAPSDRSGCCTCLGDCCGRASQSSPALPAVRAVVSLALSAAPIPAESPRTSPASRRPYARPYANGPPERA
jgi:hypothetical protein